MESPSVLSLSIVLTAYQCTRRDKGAAIFQRTLDSLAVAIQQFQRHYPQVPLDGVIVDDRSTDHTVAIAQTWLNALNLSSPWQLVSQPQNQGLSAARNRGARETQGDILCFCDDDDIYFPQHFQKIYEGFQMPLPLAAPFLVDLPGDRPAIVSTSMGFSNSIHPQWKQGLESTMIQNRGIRRTLHNFIGGFPEDPCFRSGGEDIAYSRWAETFGRRHHLLIETLEYCRYPGSHFDRQLEQFQRSPNLEQLGTEQGAEDQARDQARHRVYRERDRQLRATFNRQWWAFCHGLQP
ncbi:MAG: glycosyltransferase family 2 protein [Cyanobacteria bacterium P01_C01_bin.89]